MNGIFGMNAIFTEERLVSMTLVNGKTVHRCMTIATSLQEALQRKESVGRLVNQAMRDGTLQGV